MQVYSTYHPRDEREPQNDNSDSIRLWLSLPLDSTQTNTRMIKMAAGCGIYTPEPEKEESGCPYRLHLPPLTLNNFTWWNFIFINVP